MAKLKRKASNSKLENSPKRSPKRATSPIKLIIRLPKPVLSPKKSPVKVNMEPFSPSSKINILKLDVVSCNGRDISLVELGAADLEKIWTEGILRNLGELTGYTSYKTDTVIRVQYQLKKPMSLRDVVLEAEFNFERSTARGLEILKIRVVGLSGLRPAAIGERVRLSIIKPNFDVSPEQAIEWISRFGRVHENHRYNQTIICFLLSYYNPIRNTNTNALKYFKIKKKKNKS